MTDCSTIGSVPLNTSERSRGRPTLRWDLLSSSRRVGRLSLCCCTSPSPSNTSAHAPSNVRHSFNPRWDPSLTRSPCSPPFSPSLPATKPPSAHTASMESVNKVRQIMMLETRGEADPFAFAGYRPNEGPREPVPQSVAAFISRSHIVSRVLTELFLQTPTPPRLQPPAQAGTPQATPRPARSPTPPNRWA